MLRTYMVELQGDGGVSGALPFYRVNLYGERCLIISTHSHTRSLLMKVVNCDGRAYFTGGVTIMLEFVDEPEGVRFRGACVGQSGG